MSDGPFEIDGYSGVASTKPSGAGPRDATRGGVNVAALPRQRGRESPLSIDWPTWREMLPKYLGDWVKES